MQARFVPAAVSAFPVQSSKRFCNRLNRQWMRVRWLSGISRAKCQRSPGKIHNCARSVLCPSKTPNCNRIVWAGGCQVYYCHGGHLVHIASLSPLLELVIRFKSVGIYASAFQPLTTRGAFSPWGLVLEPQGFQTHATSHRRRRFSLHPPKVSFKT